MDAGDIYFLLDGGMSGNVGAMLKAFNGKDKVSKTFTVLKDLASVDKRHERVRGVGNVKQTETLLVVSQNQINLPPVKYQQFTGGTNGDVIGPVVLAPPETQWQATWAEKKEIFGPDQLIEVGGKLEVDAPADLLKRRKPRTDDTVEPVFFHSMPVLFYQELLVALNIRAVIDLTPGEGTCATACVKRMLPYVGVTFNEQHSARLNAHLERVVLTGMVTQGDPLYDVNFANVVKGIEPPVPSQPSASQPSASQPSASQLPTPAKRPTPAAPTAAPAAQRPKPKPEPADDPVALEPELALSSEDG